MRKYSLVFLVLLAGQAWAQAPSRPQPVVESYYKLAPGKGEEWLSLYRKWHLPILEEQRKEGRILSITMYQPQLHTGAPAWDYKVILRYSSFGVMGDTAHTGEITRRLYPNEEELRKNERRRWEITERHWDDFMVEVPPQ